MSQKNNLNLTQIVKIKLQEFYWFYKEIPEYYCYINHLNEIDWLNENEAEQQHEFYLLDPQEEKLIKAYVGKKPGKLDEYTGSEKGVRRVFRRYLCQKHNLPMTPDLEPGDGEIISEQQVEKIALFFQPGVFRRKMLLLPGIILSALLVIILAAWYISTLQTGGELLVRTGDDIADVYLDTVYLGKSNQIFKNIPPGERMLKVEKSGFEARPPRQKILIRKDSVVTVDINLVRRSEVKYGYLKIETNVREAQVYLDEVYFGNLKDYPLINLSSGRHKVEVKKDFYTTSPQCHWIEINAHDTTTLTVELQLPEQKNYQIKATPSKTYLEVFSNVPGAIIILNDQPTAMTTDYIFTDLKPQKYKVKLYKKGYEFSPEFVNVDLLSGSASQRARFEGELVINEASIVVNPAGAQIIIDGKSRGAGSFTGNLSLGKHTLNIIAPDGYANFIPEEFEVVQGIPFTKEVNLVPFFTYSLKVDNRGNIQQENTRYLSGFYETNRGFSYSSSAGPELIFEESLQNYIWKMGFAYPYLTPKGNDAIQVKFDFNYDLSLVSNVQLVILAGISEEKYPRTFSSNAQWRVTLNNYKLHEVQEVTDKGQPGQLVRFTWNITEQLKYSENTLEISTTDDNEVFLYLKEIIVTNK